MLIECNNTILDYVDKIKFIYYNIIIKYDIKFLDSAIREFSELSPEQQEILKKDYYLIKEVSIEYVLTRPLGDKIFEIKTSNLRSLYKYQENQIIIIGVIYIKQTQKTPKEILKLAKKRLKGC